MWSRPAHQTRHSNYIACRVHEGGSPAIIKGRDIGDKLSLDLFWIKDKTLTDTDSLPAPDIMAAEIADDLEAALEQFTKIAARLARKEN